MNIIVPLNAILIGVSALFVMLLALELWLDLKWARKARMMELKRGWR